jgi:hypothetical protein
MTGFDVAPTVPVCIGDDVRARPTRSAPTPRSTSAAWGRGSKNFYNALARRYGYDEAAATIQDRYLAKDYVGAMAAVPFELIDETSLIGPAERSPSGCRPSPRPG